MSNKFEIGEEINFLNESGGGVVVSCLPGKKYLIEDKDGFEEIYAEQELVVPFRESDLIPKPVTVQTQMIKEEKEITVEPDVISENGFYIGELVRPVDEEGEGVISHFERGMVFINMEAGITLDFHYTKIVSVKKENDQLLLDTVELQETVFKIEDFAKEINAKSTIRKDSGVWEIDLHVHEITEETNNLTSHQLLQIQMDHFEKKLNEAIIRQVRRIIFIHGRGKGKLKNEIRKVLDRYPNCEYLDGSYRNYGVGATEVLIRNTR